MVATFNGNLSEVLSGAPVASAEVDVVVTLPDTSTDPFTVLTDVSGNFSTTRNYDVAGDYTSVATFAGDATHKSATAQAAFTVTPALKDVTLTLNVTVA